MVFSQYHGAPLLLTDILSYMNLTFTMCFTFECVLKLIAYGPGVGPSLTLVSESELRPLWTRTRTHSTTYSSPQSYFKDSWNTFDFVTVVGSIVDALMVEFAVYLPLFVAL